MSSKILIVDDVTKNIQLVANYLKQSGYEIYYALNGPMALEQIKNHTLDLILLDIMMPEMDGFEVCKKLKEDSQFADIPVMFLTAKTDIESIKRGFDVGGVDYITKPFDRSELLARVRTHLDLKHQKAELTALNATKDKFFSIIAHDLKSPFNHLLGLSEIIQQMAMRSEEEEIHKMANMINDSAKKGRDLLENLLHWSRAQTGSITFEPNIIDLREVCADIIQFSGQIAKEKSIDIENKVKAKTFCEVDTNMLQTVVRNLLNNAIKFTQVGGKVTISARKLNDMIEVTVKDNGIGIADEHLERLFKIEENPSTIGTREEKGSGLGLILCKEFIERHKGKIWAESTLGDGSEFKFTVPKA
jgi:signal transduction histidine kinase